MSSCKKVEVFIKYHNNKNQYKLAKIEEYNWLSGVEKYNASKNGDDK